MFDEEETEKFKNLKRTNSILPSYLQSQQSIHRTRRPTNHRLEIVQLSARPRWVLG